MQIVCVVNNVALYEKAVKNNSYLSNTSLCMYDNTKENLGISRRYNHFIKNRMRDDSWVIFTHQDFNFLEDPLGMVTALDPNYVYGPIGAKRIKGIFFRNFKVKFEKKVLLGQIDQARGDNQFSKDGIFLRQPRQVDTLDCCCMIVHSSLIKKHNLLFDERFSFHLYAEDFSLNARYNYGVETKAVQIKCQHLSVGGTINNEFIDLLSYLKAKYQGRQFVGTCF